MRTCGFEFGSLDSARVRRPEAVMCQAGAPDEDVNEVDVLPVTVSRNPRICADVSFWRRYWAPGRATATRSGAPRGLRPIGNTSV